MKPRDNDDSSAEKPATGFPEPPGRDPGGISQDESPHHVLNTPVEAPAATEREDSSRGPERRA
jgi:hypothetical protein